MDIDLSLFKYVVLPGRDPHPKYTHLYQEAYSCWHSVWCEAYKELKLDKKMFSDDFTRQTEVSCIFYGDECVGLLFLTWADLANPALIKDSYFRIWSKEDMSFLTRFGSTVLICSNTTVSSKWRKQHCDLSMKDLMLYLICKRFKHSAAAAMTGVTRRARGVHELTYRFGAVPIRENVSHFDENDKVDIVAFFKNSVSEGVDSRVKEIGAKMWAEKIVVPRTVVDLPQEAEMPLPLKRVA